MQGTQVQSLGQEDPPGEGNGNPLQYSCLENPMDGWRSPVGHSLWGRKESDTTERPHFHFPGTGLLIPLEFPETHKASFVTL